MIIVLKIGSQEDEIQQVVAAVKKFQYEPKLIRGVERTIVACVGDERNHHTLESLIVLPQVESVTPVQKKYKLVSREYQAHDTLIDVAGLQIGGKAFHVVAGPCSVESAEQAKETAQAVKSAGATLFRGGAFKPRTSPYDFQGLGVPALEMLREAREKTGLPIVTEVMSPQDVELVARYADVLQIGARNAQNVPLLAAVAASGKPILLKRGVSGLVDEWLLAAEYICVHGNSKVILCERGIRTFEHACRNTLDLSAVAVAKKETHLPVFVDPSHAAGRADMIIPLARAAVAVGADGLLVEVHPDPAMALSDGGQQLKPAQFQQLMDELQPIVAAMGRQFAGA
ncbi:MAG: Phospho-2-dehydro-3-deoxyheptonate aldolase [Verrucomicrobiae bacterium]|nr:Phospho-2-dehydro-3-deoxyheptonate aldolase [Verrucomicrobiae bacterium]